MEMNIMLEDWAFMPTRAHEEDAGLDLRSTVDFEMEPFSSVTINTGVHVQLPEGTVGIVKSRSSLMTMKDVTTDGTIDEGYTGSIGVHLFNDSNKTWKFKKGDKIAQLVIFPIIKPELNIVSKLAKTKRGNGGFGSTGV